MPSAPGYKRNYSKEYKTAKTRGEVATGHDSGSAERHRARRLAVKKGMVSTGDGKDVDHIKPLSKGGTTTPGNLRVESAHDNRSYPRTRKGAIKGKA